MVIVLCLFFSSCASVFNPKTTRVTIETEDTGQLVINNDSTNSRISRATLRVQRSEYPLHIQLNGDQSEKEVWVGSRNSFAYWFNMSSPYLIGFLFDRNRTSRYTYPTYIYINSSTEEPSYTTYFPFDHPQEQHNNAIKFFPTRLMGLVHPGLSLSYERYHGSKFSTELKTSMLFTDYQHGPVQIGGIQLGLEEKFFFSKRHGRPYVAVGMEYLRKEYTIEGDYCRGGIINDSLMILDECVESYRETHAVQKRLFIIHTKLGVQHYFNKHFFIDTYAGFGLKYRKVRHLRSRPDDPVEEGFLRELAKDRQGNFWTVTFPLNFSLGWRF